MKITVTIALYLLLYAPAAFAQEMKKYVTRDLELRVYNSIVIMADGSTYAHAREVDSILVIERNSDKRVQRIVPEENSYISMDSNDPLTVEDMNFDGYVDISIIQFVPAGPNIPRYCWIYDVSKGTFVRDKPLEAITSPVFDAKAQTVVSEWRDGAGSYGTSSYKYIAGKLALVKEVTKTAAEDNGDMIVVSKELVNGKMKVMSKKRSKDWD